jgi:hypothetical protein
MQMGPNGGRITVPSTSGPYYLGYRLVSTSAYSSQELCRFSDPSGNQQVSFWTNANGTISVYCPNSGGVLLGTSSVAVTLAQNVWDYLECGASIDASTGTINVRINGVSVLSLAAQNTKGSGSSSLIGQIGIGSNLTPWFQDIYVTDSLGSYNVGFLGDVHITAFSPTSSGSHTDYTANGAASLWQGVAAATPTDSTVFDSDSNPGDKLSVNLAPSSVTGAIAAVVLVGRMEKTSAGTRTANLFALNGGVEVDGANIALGTSYQYSMQVLEIDPATGVPFVNNGFNTLQAGVATAS